MMGSFSGSKAKLNKVDTLSHKQKARLNKYMSMIHPGAFDLSKNKSFMEAGNFLQGMLNPNSTENQNLAAPYMRQFEEEIVPQTAESFTQYDAQESSAFNQAMTKQAGSLSDRLAGLQTQNMLAASQGAMQYGQIQPNIYQNMMNSGMGARMKDYMVLPGQEGWGNSALGALGKIGGTAATLALL